MDTKMVKMAPFTNMPDNIRKIAEKTTASIIRGDLNPFAGPIFRQDGVKIVDEDETLDLEKLMSMDWYVRGLEEDFPGR
jgi:simple sugar transport system substrate-binding protein